jgi:hypothetical protein
MSDIDIVGDIPEEEGRKLKQENPFSIGFLLPDEAYGQKMLIYRKGVINLGDANSLWRLLGSEKADQMHDLLRHQIQDDDKVDEDYGYPMSVEDIEKLLAFIDGLNEGLLAITDEKYDVRPEYLEFVKSKTTRLLDSRQRADGSWEHSLYGSLSSTRAIAWFLRIGLQMIREHNCKVYCG